MSRLVKFGAQGRPLRSGPTMPTVNIYKGGPKTDKRPGKDLDHFRVEWPDGFGDVAAVFADLYGDQPARLSPIYVMSDDVGQVFPTRMESYRMGKKGPTLVRSCDGEQITFIRDGDTVHRNPGTPCLGDCDCKPVGRLFFILPEFFRACGQLIQFRLVTHSKTDIEGILGTLDFVADNNRGSLKGVAFDLYRELQTIQTPDGIDKQTHVVRVSVGSAHMQQLAASIMSTDALPSGYEEELPALPARVNIPRHYGQALDPDPDPVGWATKRVLSELHKAFNRARDVDVSYEAFCRLASMDPAADPDDWSRLYPTRQDAAAAITQAHDAQEGGDE